MKAINYLTVLAVAIFTNFVLATAQDDLLTDSTGLPGDNFSLHGALEMFKKASSPEEFEKLINKEDNNVNNLDMNGDGETDYIRVIDIMDKDLHAFILQVPVSETESQDIAVIEMEKTGDTTVILQIIGDEDIYGEEIIIEPGEGEDDAAFIEYNNNRIQSGSYSFYNYTAAPRIVVNVWQIGRAHV